MQLTLIGGYSWRQEQEQEQEECWHWKWYCYCCLYLYQHVYSPRHLYQPIYGRQDRVLDLESVVSMDHYARLARISGQLTHPPNQKIKSEEQKVESLAISYSDYL